MAVQYTFVADCARGSRKAREGSHIAKHVEQFHRGEDPHFYMKVVGFHRSALSRQTAEAVRIRRRGGEGAVLNSKAEFNRCFLPRLKLVEEQEISVMEQAEQQADKEMVEQLREVDRAWETGKSRIRSNAIKKVSMGSSYIKRSSREQIGAEKPSKRRKYALVEPGWGTKTTNLEELNKDYMMMEQQVIVKEHRATETGEQMGDNDQVTRVIRKDDHTDHLVNPIVPLGANNSGSKEEN